MPQRKTAKKELRKNLKRRQRNLRIKKGIKTSITKLKKSLESKDVDAADTLRQALTQTYKVLDRAASRGVIHPRKAARKKSRLSSLLNKQIQKEKGK